MQVQAFGQSHVYRDVGGGRACEKGGDAAFAQAQEHQRIRVFTGFPIHNQRVHYKSHQGHAAHQHQQQLAVFRNHLAEAGGSGCYRHQTENADGRQADNPSHDGGHGVRQVVKKLVGGGRRAAQGDAQQNRPHQNADIVRVNQRGERVGHQVHQQRFQHFGNALRRFHFNIGIHHQRERAGEGQAGNHGHQRGAECAQQVQKQNRAHIGFGLAVLLGDGGGHQNKHQKRRDAFQRAHK